MRGDLNEQFQRAQAVTDDEGPRKWLIALVIALVVGFMLVMIGGVIFFVKTMDMIVDTVPSSGTSTTAAEGDNSSGFDPFSPGNNSSTGKTGSSDNATSSFKYGTVTGTSYYSEFSGLSFTAPSNWNVSGGDPGTSYSNNLAPKDLSASDPNMTCNVSVSYSAMKSHLYKEASDALDSYRNTATNGINNSLVKDNVTASYGGNKFTGILYKKTVDANFSYYTEVLVTEINGYVLEIYVEANSESDLNSILGMFS